MRIICSFILTLWADFYATGKSAERPVMDEDTIERNTKSIEESLRRLLQPPNSGLPEPKIVNNLDWFGDMPLLVFLRDVGEAFCC